MILNNDYKDILRALSEKKAKFIMVGAYAMAAHGYPRSTMDIDLWIMPEQENASLVFQALKDFGTPVGDLSVDVLSVPDLIKNKLATGRLKDQADAEALLELNKKQR
jgi:hypothetical protein